MPDARAAIYRVLDKRQARGASDAALVAWLEGLKAVWPTARMHHYLDALIAGVKASPTPAH